MVTDAESAPLAIQGTDTIPAKIQVMGVGVTPFDGYEHATSTIDRAIQVRNKTFIAAINPEKLYAAHYDAELRTILNRPEICLCDGIGAALAVRVLFGLRIPRITGVSLFFEIIKLAAKKQQRVFLLGGEADVNALAVEKLVAEYPSLILAGNHHGYFEDSNDIVELINSSNADIVFVAMGSPKQELWITEHREQISAPICMGIGGTLDVVSGRVKWAPAFFRKTGTEWLYRLVSEPSRWRRQLALPKFLFVLAKYKLGLGDVHESQT